jgi:hypothetical protein
MLGAWSAAISIWGPLAIVLSASPPKNPDPWPIWALLSLAGLGSVATVALGFELGRHRLRRLFWTVPLAAAGIGDCWYIACMAASPDPNSDNAAGIGAVLLAPCFAILYGALLGIGWLLSLIASRSEDRGAA